MQIAISHATEIASEKKNYIPSSLVQFQIVDRIWKEKNFFFQINNLLAILAIPATNLLSFYQVSCKLPIGNCNPLVSREHRWIARPRSALVSRPSVGALSATLNWTLLSFLSLASSRRRLLYCRSAARICAHAPKRRTKPSCLLKNLRIAWRVALH